MANLLLESLVEKIFILPLFRSQNIFSGFTGNDATNA